MMVVVRNNNKASLTLLVSVALVVGGMAIGRLTFNPDVLLEKISTLDGNLAELKGTLDKQRLELATTIGDLNDELSAMRLKLDVAAAVAVKLVEIRARVETKRLEDK